MMMRTKDKLKAAQVDVAFWKAAATRRADELETAREILVEAEQALRDNADQILQHRRITAFVRMILDAHAAGAVSLATAEVEEDDQVQARFGLHFDPDWLAGKINDYWGELYVRGLT